jgi:hypothetical protein
MNAAGTMTIPGGGPFLNPGNSFSTPAILSAGIYTIKLLFSGGTSETSQGEILQPSSPLILSGSVTNPKCPTVTGTIKLLAGSGYPPYIYKLKNTSGVYMSGVDDVFSNLPSGQYFGEVTDNINCTEYTSTPLNVIIPTAISAPLVEIDSIDYPSDLAKITLRGLPSDINNYRFLLNGNVIAPFISGSKADISGISSGLNQTIRVERIDCSSDYWSTNFNITPYNPIGFSWSPNTNPNNVSINCFGGDTTLTVTITGGKTGKTVDLRLIEGGIPRSLASSLPFNVPYPISNLKANTEYILIAITDDPEINRQPRDVFRLIGPTISFEIANVTPTNVTCNGEDNGKALATITGGTSPFKYTLNNSTPDFSSPTLPTNRTITGLMGGLSYNLVLMDEKGCISDPFNFSISEPNPISVSVLDGLTVQLSCPNSNSGQIFARGAGGTKPYYFTLEKDGAVVAPYSNIPVAGDTAVFTNLADGIYTVKIKDGFCTAVQTDNETIDPITVNVNITFDPIQCNNGTTDIKATATGGDGTAFTYKIINSATGAVLDTKTETTVGSGVIFDTKPAASYRVQALYGSCNPVSRDTLIVNPQPLRVIYDPVHTLLCPGNSKNVTINATGNYPFEYSLDGITYSIFTTQSSFTLNNLTVGSYTFYVRDKFGCVYNNGLPSTIEVKEPAAILVSDLIAINETCREKNDGKVSLMVSGGSAGYRVTMGSYTQTSSTGDILFNNVEAGTYNMVIEDRNGCVALNPPTGIIIDQPAEIFTIQDPIIDPIECNGDETTIVATVTGGWDVTKEVWLTSYGYTSPKQPSNSSFVIKAGNYTIHASNADGCTATKAATVSQPDKLQLKVLGKTNVSCYDANDATIRIQATGGTPVYSYDLDGSGSGSNPFSVNPYTITGDIEAGSYNVILSDANGCKSNIVPVTISEPEQVDFTIKIDSVTCYGLSTGKIYIQNAKGGNDNSYRGFLTNSSGVIEPFAPPVISGLKAGNYSVRITDSKNCTSELKTATVGQPDVIVINGATISDSLSCFGDQDAVITVDAMGGLPYNLQYKITGRSYQDGNEFEGLIAGDYEVWVRNSLGNCETKFAQKLFIENPRPIDVTKIDPTNVSCHNLQDGSVRITAEGGTGNLSYLLVGAPASIAPNPNANGQFDQLGDLNQSVSNYNYKVEDTKGCKKTGSFSISNPDELIITELDHHQVRCNNEATGWILVKPSGGVGNYTFKNTLTDSDTIRFSNGEYLKETDSRIKISKLQGGNYRPVVIDGNGCADTIAEFISIINPPPLKIANVTVGDKKCFDSVNDSTVITLSGTDFGTRGAYKYTINNWARINESKELQSVFVNVRDTIVYPMVMDTMGCVAIAGDEEVEWPDAFNVSVIQQPITCWDNQYGSLATQIEGGVKPYYIGVNDPTFTNSPVIIDKAVPGAVSRDTIEGNVQNGLFYFDNSTGWDIYITDENKCVALNSGNVNSMNAYFYKNYKWVSVDTFEVLDIKTKSPDCSFSDASITIVTNNKGDAPYQYWAQYYEPGTKEYITADSSSSSILNNVPADKIFTWNVVDLNKCAAKVDEKLFPYGQDIFIPAVAEKIDVQHEIFDFELPSCPDVSDGIIRINITGFSREGVKFNIWETDSLFVPLNIRDTLRSPERAWVNKINASERDSFYFIQRENPLTGELIPSDTLFILMNDSIDFLFYSGYFLVEFEDLGTTCKDTITFFLEPKDSICPDKYPLVFTPNDDTDNDEWIINTRNVTNPVLWVFNSEGEMVYEFPPKRSDNDAFLKGFAKGGLKWDGLDFKGRPVPAGTYMYYYDNSVKDSTKGVWNTITILRGRN